MTSSRHPAATGKAMVDTSWLALGAATVAGILSYGRFPQEVWIVVLASVPVLVHLTRARNTAPLHRVHAIVLVFLLTACVGVWAAYDRHAALAKFWVLVATLLVFYALATQRPRNLPVISRWLAYGSGLVALYFLLFHDWERLPAGMSVIDGIGQRWMALRPDVGLPAFHPNKMAGIMAMLAPFPVESGLRAWQRGKEKRAYSVVIVGLLLAVGLLATGSRGAWLALASGFGAWCLWFLSHRVAGRARISGQLLFLILLLLLGLLVVLLAAFPGGALALAGQLPGEATAPTRLALFRQALDLSGDFLFTGGGMASFPGLYARYILVLPVPFFFYSHNLYLDVLLEQGVLGLSALIAVLLISGWRLVMSAQQDAPRRRLRHLNLLRYAVLASLMIVLIHGLVDDALYGERGTPLLLVAPGLALAVTAASQPEERKVESKKQLKRRREWMAATLVVGLMVVTGMLSATVQAAWQANLGAVRMARVELASGPGLPLPGPSEEVALIPAGESFQKALALDAGNRTAHHRLGLIAYAAGDFTAAVEQLATAYALDSGHRGIQKVLGLSYVWSGQYARALPLLQSLPESEHELADYGRRWRQQGRGDLADKATEMLALLAGAE